MGASGQRTRRVKEHDRGCGAVRTMNRTLLLIQRVLFGGAIVTVGCCGMVVTKIWVFQYEGKQTLDRLPKTEQTGTAELLPVVGTGGLIGSLEVPRLGLSVVIVEGTGDAQLGRAAGHIKGTALPGERGNAGIAGHRDTFFRPLRKIRRNDLISVMTPHGNFQYRVVSTEVVSSDDLAVLDGDEREVLTLVTCYPFYFVGPAPRRFIVRAERIT